MLDENTEAVSEEVVEDSAGALESEKPKKRTKRATTATKTKESAKGESRKDGRRTRPAGRRNLSTRRRSGTKRIGGSSATDAENSQNELHETAKKNLPPLTDENRVISIPQLESLGRDQLLTLAEDVSSQQDEFVSKD